MRKKEARKMRRKSRVAIVGAMTIDEIVYGKQSLERPGGPPSIQV